MNILGQKKHDVIQEKPEMSKEQEITTLLATISRVLEQLQESVDSNITLNQSEQKTFSDWFSYMESLSWEGVDDVKKQQLHDLNTELHKGQENVVISKEHLQIVRSSIEETTSFAHAKLDTEKSKELTQGLGSFSEGLTSLQQAINKKKEEKSLSKEQIIKEFEEKKKESIQEAADDFVNETEKTRWGRAVNKVFDIKKYIQDKYVDKKPIGRIKEYIATTILGLLGFKVFKDKVLDIQLMKPEIPDSLKDVGDKAKDLAQTTGDKIKDTQEVIETEVQKRLEEEKAKEEQRKLQVEKIADNEREQIAEQILKPKYREALSIRGPIDESTWNKIWKKWYAGNKDIVLQHADNIKRDFALAKEDKERFHTLGYVLETIAIPAKSFWELFTICKEEGVLEPSDVVANSAMKGGKQVFQLGVKSFNFLGGSFLAITGAVSLEEVAKGISEVSLDNESRMALWGLLYRHGGLFHKLLSNVADISGALLGTWMQQGVELDKMSAYLKGGMMADTNKQIGEFRKFENSLRESGVFKGSLTQHGGADLLDDMLNTMTVSADAVNISKGLGKTGSEGEFKKFKEMMEAKGPEHKKFVEDIESKFKSVDRQGSGFDYRKYVKDAMKSRTESVTTGLTRGKLGTLIDDVMGSVSQTFNASFRSQARQIMENMNYALAETLMTTEEWIPRRLLWNNSRLGSKLAETVEFRHRLSFYAKTPQDLKDIREKLEYMSSKAPHMLGSLVHHAPVILVGKEVVDAIQEGGNAGWEITKGFASLAPIIGPVYLLNDAISWQGNKPIDLEKATLSMMILAQDTWVTLSTKGNQNGRQWLAKSLLRPVSSTMSVAGNMAGWTYQSLKMAAIDMPKIYGKTVIQEMKAYTGLQKAIGVGKGTLKFAGSALKESAILSGRAGLKIAGLAALAYGGYYYVNQFIDNRTGTAKDKEELQKILDHYNTKSPDYAHKELSSMYQSIEDSGEKEQFLRHRIQVALYKRLGMKDLTGVEVGNVTSDPITVSLKEFHNKVDRDNAGEDIAQALVLVVGKEKVNISFNYNGKLLEETYSYYKQQFIKEGKNDTEASSLALEAYKNSLAQNGESDTTINSIISKLN